MFFTLFTVTISPRLFPLSVGHYLDQKRLKQGLYRHPWDDISYIPHDSV